MAVSRQLRVEEPPERQESIQDFAFLLEPIMRGIAHTFGRNCEVVLHDFQQPDGSVVAIAGNVTARGPGASASEIALELIAQGDDTQDYLSDVTRTPTGRLLKSSTIVLRAADRRVLGALCINFDVTDLRLAAGTLGELSGANAAPGVEPKPLAFGDEIDKLIRAVIDEEEVALGRPIDRMNKHDRITVFQALDRRGLFGLQRSVPQVAEYLGISRATAYSYLEEIRSIDTKET